MKTPLRTLIWSAVTLVSLATLGALVAPEMSGWLQSKPTQGTALLADPACNPIDQGCTVKNDTLSMTLQFGGQVQPLIPFPTLVHLTGTNAHIITKVTLDFSMADMDMGINRFDLKRRQDGIWEGQARLPTCHMGGRDWNVRVETTGYGDTSVYTGQFHMQIHAGTVQTPSAQ